MLSRFFGWTGSLGGGWPTEGLQAAICVSTSCSLKSGSQSATPTALSALRLCGAIWPPYRWGVNPIGEPSYQLAAPPQGFFFAVLDRPS